MPFHPFDYCIICEGFRQEIGGKLTILGFYNLAPYADIAIVNPNVPVVLAFVAGFAPAEDADAVQYMYSLQITSPDNRPINRVQALRLNVSSSARGFVGHSFVIPPPCRFGIYTIQITVNGHIELENSFRLRPAIPTELAGMGIMPPATGRPN